MYQNYQNNNNSTYNQQQDQQTQQSQYYQSNPLGSVKSAYDLLKEEKLNTRQLPTGISQFDKILDGGILKGYISEVYGEAGSGKTQFGVQLMLNSLKNQQTGSIDGRSLYMTFGKIISDSRIQKLQETFIKKQQLNPNTDFQQSNQLVFQNVQKFDEFQKFLNEDLIAYLNDKRYQTRVLVIDEIANVSREEFSQQQQYKEKTQFLIQLTQYLKQLALEHNFAILIINSVVQDNEKKVPALGPFWSTLINERYKLWREERKYADLDQLQQLSNQQQQKNFLKNQQIIQRKLKIKFSPRLERNFAHFIIDEEGFK